MQETKSLPQRRPAETATGLAGAAVALLVATTGLSTELATALVVLVGGLPGVVTAIVNLRRSTAAGQMLKAVTESMASWSDVLIVEPGAEAPPEQGGGQK